MATCAVNGNLIQPDGSAATSVTVSARVVGPVVSGTSVIAPYATDTTTDSSGNFVLTIQQSCSVIFTVQYPIVGTEPMRTFNYTANVPATASAAFTSIIVIE